MNMIATRRPSGVPPRIIVAIPAKNEADSIGDCLEALAFQRGANIDAAVVCLNNCTDGSAAILGQLAGSLPFILHVMDIALPPERAFAGTARKIAMDRAADLAGPDGIVLTTDADGQVAPEWLAANLDALRRGADAVAGQADIDPGGAALIPAHLHAADAEECAYGALLDEINALIDPDPADPWPRHDEHSGASIAVTVAAYRLAGGMPAARLGEDRAFFAALRCIDARIRHTRDARVVVSARTTGRAAGGMADTILRRMSQMDAFLDDRLEFLPDAVRRARLRARLREAWQSGLPPEPALAAELLLPLGTIEELIARPYFGSGWADVEAYSPALVRRRVPVSAVREQTELATATRDALRAGVPLSLATDPADIPVAEAVG